MDTRPSGKIAKGDGYYLMPVFRYIALWPVVDSD